VRLPPWLPSRPALPGVALAAALGAASLGVARALPPSPYVSDILIALLLGAVVLNTPLRKPLGLALPGPDREPDRYAIGLRYTGTWVLRLGIILMGLKVQTSFFGTTEIALILGVAAASIPSAFMVAHVIGALANLRRPLVDLLAGGTMICGASAVNAIAPLTKAHRGEQGLAIGVVFLFSIVALVVFHPIASAIGLSPSFAGLWSGLAVNDLSSAVAVGAQMGGSGGVMAAASKSARILMLAPTLVAFSLMRQRGGGPVGMRSSIVSSLPGFILGYIALAVLRAVGDRMLVGPSWASLLSANKVAVDFLMLTVSAGIGLHLGVRSLLSSGVRAVLVGGGASVWMASLTLAMVTAIARGSGGVAAAIGMAALAASWMAYRVATRDEVELRSVRSRFDRGSPLSLAESTQLLDAREHEGAFDEPFLRKVLVQLHPSIGELIPVRKSPLPHGEGCRWVTYWEGKSGWALVALCREPGSETPIHAHPHRLLGKAIEGVLEELRFREVGEGEVELASRTVLGHEELVETEPLTTLHVVRAVGLSPTIDLQLRGPEIGRPGRRLSTVLAGPITDLAVGARLRVTEHVDDRPGQGGEGASVGRVPDEARAAGPGV